MLSTNKTYFNSQCALIDADLSYVGREEFEDRKGVIKIRKSKDRQNNDQSTNNDLQNITQKTKHLATWTPLKTGVNSYSPGSICR